MSITYEQALTRHNVEIPAHLEAQAEVPVLTGLQRQGDLIIAPIRSNGNPLRPVGAGVQVVRGEATGNTHWLNGDDGVAYTRVGDAVIVSVPECATAVLTHTDEHGANAMGPGLYRISRQREQADEVRLVAD